MAAIQIIPTRMELARLKKKLLTAVRSHKLLKDKRDELMRRFLELAKENMRLRLEVEEGIRKAHEGFAMAKASMETDALHTALMTPKQDLLLEIRTESIMSVEFPVFSCRSGTGNESDGKAMDGASHMDSYEGSERDIYPYGFAFTSGDLDRGVRALHGIRLRMVELAGTEKACQRLAAEIERTRRRVNALEYVVIPETKEGIHYITMKLDENERSSQIRLLKVKDKMVESVREF